MIVYEDMYNKMLVQHNAHLSNSSYQLTSWRYTIILTAVSFIKYKKVTTKYSLYNHYVYLGWLYVYFYYENFWISKLYFHYFDVISGFLFFNNLNIPITYLKMLYVNSTRNLSSNSCLYILTIFKSSSLMFTRFLMMKEDFAPFYVMVGITVSSKFCKWKISFIL